MRITIEWAVALLEFATRGVGCKLDFRFSLLYGPPAPRSESQLLEAWPASIYGHLREQSHKAHGTSWSHNFCGAC